MKDEVTPRALEDIKTKCVEELTKDLKKAIEERDKGRQVLADTVDEEGWAAHKLGTMTAKYKHLSEQYAKAIKDLNELVEGCAKALDGPHSDVETSIEQAIAKHKEKE